MFRVAHRERHVALIWTVLISCIGAGRQQPAVQQPAVQQPAIPTTGFAGLDQYRASRIAVFTDDYRPTRPLSRRQCRLSKPPAPGENRVVFFGDSITDIWKLEDYFPGKPYLNRGIGGQTTPQMLVRFRQDVIDLHPKVVVILAGTNDIAGNTGPMRLEDIEANYASLAELARANQYSRGFFLGPAGAQLHAEVAGLLRAALAGENSGAESLAEGLLRRQRPGLSRLLHRRWWTTKAC